MSCVYFSQKTRIQNVIVELQGKIQETCPHVVGLEI